MSEEQLTHFHSGIISRMVEHGNWVHLMKSLGDRTPVALVEMLCIRDITVFFPILYWCSAAITPCATCALPITLRCSKKAAIRIRNSHCESPGYVYIYLCICQAMPLPHNRPTNKKGSSCMPPCRTKFWDITGISGHWRYGALIKCFQESSHYFKLLTKNMEGEVRLSRQSLPALALTKVIKSQQIPEFPATCFTFSFPWFMLEINHVPPPTGARHTL